MVLGLRQNVGVLSFLVVSFSLEAAALPTEEGALRAGRRGFVVVGTPGSDVLTRLTNSRFKLRLKDFFSLRFAMASRERRPLDPLPVLPRDEEGWVVGPSVAAGRRTLSCLFRGAPAKA